MDLNKPEVDAVAAVSKDVVDYAAVLSEIELTLIGGGQGDVSFG